MRLNNLQIRFLIENRRLRYDEVARAIGIVPSTFSHWLQTELTPEQRNRTLQAIEAIGENKE